MSTVLYRVLDGHADTLVRSLTKVESERNSPHLHLDLPRPKRPVSPSQVMAICALTVVNPIPGPGKLSKDGRGNITGTKKI